MKKRAFIYDNYANIVVLSFYLDIIKNALSLQGYTCEYAKTLEGVDKSDLIVFPMAKDACRYYAKGYRNFILWQQGATGAESYMRHQSNLRKGVLDFLDCFAMKKAKMIFFVSEYMKTYYEEMAHADFSEKAYVMPCFNEELDARIFEEKDYTKKTFAYVGSLSPWQCFEETADVYAQIEQRIPDAFLKVLTFDVDKAKQILAGKGVRNYSVACVPKERVREELKDVTYGFLLRRDDIVNRVATPTKISSYLAAGVIPIYSTCLTDFARVAEGKSFDFPVAEGKEELYRRLNESICADALQKDIEEVFCTYYSGVMHVQRITEQATKCLK